MSASPFAALIPFGWTERVHAQWMELASSAARPVAPGRVVRVERGACHLVDATAAAIVVVPRCPLAVGDWVILDATGVVDLLPRWSTLVRADPAPSGAQAGVQVLASNVDVVVVTAPADRVNAARVEREVTLVWESGARPVVALTKCDLDDGTGIERLSSRLLGVDVVATSARRGNGLDAIGRVLGPGTTGVLLGPSGAGKSTLVNALVGEEVLATGTTRATDGRGRHTTTSRQLVPLPTGGVLIDMPGLRSLGITGPAELGNVFPDVEALAADCRFRDCRHEREPGCAVLEAIASGAFDPDRLASYKKLEREAAAERRKVDPLAAREARRLWASRTRETRRHAKRRPGSD